MKVRSDLEPAGFEPMTFQLWSERTANSAMVTRVRHFKVENWLSTKTLDGSSENNISGRGIEQKWKYSFNFVGESSLMRVRRFWVEMLTHSLSNSFRKASPTFCFENQNFFNYSEWYFIRQICEYLNWTISILQYLTQ